MLVTASVATRVLAIPTSSNLALAPLPPPPPPPPPPSYLSDDESDRESDDEDDSDEPTGSKPLLPPAPTKAVTGGSFLSSSSSMLPKSTVSTTSTALAVSSLSSSSTTDQASSTKQTTLSTSTTSRVSQTSAPSSLSQSDNNEATSTSASSTLSTSFPSPSTSDQSSAATALPIGQPDSGLETEVGSSPLGTAGIILAAVFGFIALSTTIYLLYRLHRRRQKQESSGSDSEKQHTYASTAQETGVIFGRRGRNSRTSSNSDGQNEGRLRGTGRSRFSFLNRRWYSTGSQFSSQQQQQQQTSSQPNLNTTNDTTTAAATAEPTNSTTWPSPFFFTLHQPTNHNPRPPIRTNSQYYPPTAPSNASNPLPATPQTATTITRLTTDIQRNISTRTTDSQAGSGHARAYAHHGIRAPRSLVINAARSTISSISGLWTRARMRDSRVSEGSPRSRDIDTDTGNIGSPVSQISDVYHDDRGSYTPSRNHRLSNSTIGTRTSDIPYTPRIQKQTQIQTVLPMPSRWSSTNSTSTSDLTSLTQSPNTNTDRNTRPDSHGHRNSRSRFSDMPRLPLPVAVSRGSWGSKIGV